MSVANPAITVVQKVQILRILRHQGAQPIRLVILDTVGQILRQNATPTIKARSANLLLQHLRNVVQVGLDSLNQRRKYVWSPGGL